MRRTWPRSALSNPTCRECSPELAALSPWRNNKRSIGRKSPRPCLAAPREAFATPWSGTLLLPWAPLNVGRAETTSFPGSRVSLAGYSLQPCCRPHLKPELLKGLQYRTFKCSKGNRCAIWRTRSTACTDNCCVAWRRWANGLDIVRGALSRPCANLPPQLKYRDDTQLGDGSEL